MKPGKTIFTLCVLLFAGLITVQVLAANSERLMRSANRYFETLPDAMPGAEQDTPDRIVLGKKLFFDKRLSVNNQQACVTCHKLEKGSAGVDNLATSPGARGEQGTRNSPTVLNAGFQGSQFWDGRAENLVEQAKGPILNPVEMGMPSEQAVEEKLRAIDEYQQAFTDAFPGKQPSITYQNIAEAIAAFERTLITPSRFDDFLDGDAGALSEAELRGLKLFMKKDCRSCHDGALLGGTSYEIMGKKNPYDNQADQGVFTLTGDEDDRMVFKVPSLRNVALTGPYFHDGRVDTLEEAVRQMAWLQVDEKLSDQQVDDIAAFLRSLTGKQRE